MTTFLVHSIILLVIINFFFVKIKLIDRYNLYKHKINNKPNIPLSGGFFFLISFFYIDFIHNQDLFKFIYLLPIFFLGIFSDLNILNSPKVRLLIQLFLILSFIIFFDFQIITTRIPLLDSLLSYKYFNYFFVLFCILTLINGSNFSDGLNGYLLSHYIIFLASIIIIDVFLNVSLQKIYLMKMYIMPLIVFWIFNILNKNFLGDNGSYFTSFFFGIVSIEFININNNQVSPFFILAIFWYLGFENLFSIIRRIYLKKKIYEADRLHLHTRFFLFLKNRLKIKYTNSIASILLNIFFLPSYVLSIIYHDSSVFLIMIIFLNIFIYLLLYNFLLKKND